MNTEKARAALQFAGVLQRDNKDRPAVVYVPATPLFTDRQRQGPRCAHVSIKRTAPTGPGQPSHMELDCRCMAVDNPEGEPETCLAAQGGHICYHSLCAVIVSAEAGNSFVFFYSKYQYKQAQQHATEKGGKVICLFLPGEKDAGGFAVCLPANNNKPANNQHQQQQPKEQAPPPPPVQQPPQPIMTPPVQNLPPTNRELIAEIEAREKKEREREQAQQPAQIQPLPVKKPRRKAKS